MASGCDCVRLRRAVDIRVRISKPEIVGSLSPMQIIAQKAEIGR
jgi:hypothetical protein